MAPPAEILKARVINVLRSPACLDIQFTIAGSTIMGYGYGYVADMIKQDGIRIRIGNTGAFTASYDHHGSTPTFVFGDPSIVSSPDGRATIVHEATHAVIDAVRKGRTIAFGDNEVAAYLAETIYRMNTNSPLTGPLAPFLIPVARRIKSCPPDKRVYVVRPEEVAEARSRILAVYAQKARAEGKTLPTDEMMKGIEPPKPAMVPD